MRNRISRPLTVTLAAALALASLNLAPAAAASHKPAAQSTSIELSARSHWRHRGNAAALGAVLGLFGTVAALAAADRYRGGYYDGGPYYYDAPYGYYGGPYVYAPDHRSYRWHHWRHHH